jgi:hypothetical protein
MSRRQLKEQAREEELRRQREAAAVPKQPPRLPDFAPPPQLNTFGGEDARPDSVAIVSGRVPGHYQSLPQRGSSSASGNQRSSSRPMPGELVDPFPTAESMAHRGRYSYASSAVSTINSPRRVRRRKDPTPYK